MSERYLPQAVEAPADTYEVTQAEVEQQLLEFMGQTAELCITFQRLRNSENPLLQLNSEDFDIVVSASVSTINETLTSLGGLTTRVTDVDNQLDVIGTVLRFKAYDKAEDTWTLDFMPFGSEPAELGVGSDFFKALAQEQQIAG